MREASKQDRLRSPEVGLHVVRGGLVRLGGYGVGLLLAAATSVLLLRHLGVVGFGRYMTVTSLLAIVTGITDLGLAATASREVALTDPEGPERTRLLKNLMGLRLIVTPIGVAGATLFAVLADYDHTLVIGTLLAGSGAILITNQSTMTVSLVADLRLTTVVVIDVLKQLVLLGGVVALTVLGASLLPFFGIQIAVGLAALAVTPFLVRTAVGHPAFDLEVWKLLLRQTLPLAISVALSLVYLRLLIVLMSLISNPIQTGFFATSFRILDTFYGGAAVAASVALPALTVAAHDLGRLRYMLQRMIEVASIVGVLLVLLIVILAVPILHVLGGNQYGSAAPVLRIQALVLVPIFIGQMLVFTLIALRKQAAQAVANAFALVLVLALGLALIPSDGARGAAIAAVIAESGLTALLLAVLSRVDRKLMPRVGFAWKIALAAGVGALALLAPSVGPAVKALVATTAYVGVLAFTKAIPPEVLDAIPARWTLVRQPRPR